MNKIQIQNFIDSKVIELQEILKDKRIILGYSGGIDSMVCAKLLERASSDSLICVLVDYGLFRENEVERIETDFKNCFKNLNLTVVNARSEFLERLENVTEPEQKRKIIGREFIKVFQKVKNDIGNIHYLAQGTIYTDIAESGVNGKKLIKTHHNVSGLPSELGFEGMIEPIKTLYKKDVKTVASMLGLNDKVIDQQPFPGPGLAVRIIGEVTLEKLNILRRATTIVEQEIENAKINKKLWQYFPILTDLHSTGIRDSGRVYEKTVVLRAIKSKDSVRAKWSHLPYRVLDRISKRITSEIAGINRVVYDISSKPPATIEWE